MLQKFAAVSALTLATAVTTPALAQLTTAEVSPALSLASDLGPLQSNRSLTVTVHLKQPNEAAFHQAVNALYDPSSSTYHHWMTNEDLARFAPASGHLEKVRKALENAGLTIVSVDPEGFSIRARGSASVVEAAFGTSIHQFQRNGKIFRANVKPAQLAGDAGAHVAFISGLESHEAHPLLRRALDARTRQAIASIPLAQVKAAGGLSGIITDKILLRPATETLKTPGAALPVGVYYGNVYNGSGTLIPDYTPSQLQKIYGLNAAYKKGLDGTGQTIVLLEAYGYPNILADANAFSSLTGLPPLDSSNFQIVYPEGPPADPNAGVLVGWDGEIALDVQWAHAIAPGAKIVVVAASGQDDNDFEDAIRYIANHNLGNSVSDSWEIDTDLIAGSAEQKAFDKVLERAAAKGISFQFSTGDNGDEGLGSPVGSAGVPSDSPHATAVGGTSILNVVGGSGTVPTGWGTSLTFLADNGVLDPPQPYGLLFGSGGGESIYWPKPSWQASLPGTGRQTPDISALADPYTGVPVVLTSGTTQGLEVGVGGTSLASPIFTAIWAIANQKAGAPLGQAAPLISSVNAQIQDVLPTTPMSATNPAGTVFDSNGSTYYSPSALFGPLLYSQQGFTSALWTLAPGFVGDLSFGIDSSLTVTPGWDNVTGYGTPNGLTFLNAVAPKQ